MKRTIYALCTVVCALLLMTSCSKSDDEKGGGIKNNNFSNEVTAVASKDLIQKMAAGGATIYGGTNPP